MAEAPKRLVRFLKYHQGFGADIGDTLIVDAAWAARAAQHGLIEYVAEEPRAEAKPDI